MRLLRNDQAADEYIVEGDRILRLERLEGTGYEPDVDEWLALPTGPPCPSCGSTWFGSSNCTGYLLTRHCHDEHGVGCQARFRETKEEMGMTAAQIVGRLLGYRRRFLAGHYPQSAYLLDRDRSA